MHVQNLTDIRKKAIFEDTESYSLRKIPAIHAHIRAGHKTARLVARQKDRRADQFLRLAETPHRRMPKNGGRPCGGRTVLIEKQPPILFPPGKNRGGGVDANILVAHSRARNFVRGNT